MISSLLGERPSAFFILPLMFLLGFLTSLGPATLPFLPVVFGLLVARTESVPQIAVKVAGFVLSFVLTHSAMGFFAGVGALILSEVFRTELFNLLMALLLFLIALSLLDLLPFSLELSRLSSVKGGGLHSFVLGFVYTFSICPSCTSLLLGALVLSASTGSPLLGSLLMSLYAVGRSVPVFLSGVAVRGLFDLLRRNPRLVNTTVGLIFLLLSGYFFKNFLEVVL
jgi:cytochrome c-type biogenesis protein